MAIPSQGLVKICRKCGVEKPVDEFYPQNSYRGRSYAPGVKKSICKSCEIKRVAIWYRTHHADMRRKENARNILRRAKIKDAVFEAYGGYKCACCGETEKSFLTLDHVDNDGSKHRKGTLGRKTFAGAHTYLWVLKRGFPAGFQVLCMNCNWGKRTTGVCPHKTRCNDYPQGVGSSDPKRSTPIIKLVG